MAFFGLSNLLKPFSKIFEEAAGTFVSDEIRSKMRGGIETTLRTHLPGRDLTAEGLYSRLVNGLPTDGDRKSLDHRVKSLLKASQRRDFKRSIKEQVEGVASDRRADSEAEAVKTLLELARIPTDAEFLVVAEARDLIRGKESDYAGARLKASVQKVAKDLQPSLDRAARKARQRSRQNFDWDPDVTDRLRKERRELRQARRARRQRRWRRRFRTTRLGQTRVGPFLSRLIP